MCWLLGIRDKESLAFHSARGALFETWVVSEFIKKRFNQGQPADLYFWRDSLGHEIDLVYETPRGLQAIEIKSGSTWSNEWIENAQEWQFISKETLQPIVIYGGDQNFERQGCQAMAWSGLSSYCL